MINRYTGGEWQEETLMNSEWQLNRIGLLDFWYYDDQEFEFVDGRMLL